MHSYNKPHNSKIPQIQNCSLDLWIQEVQAVQEALGVLGVLVSQESHEDQLHLWGLLIQCLQYYPKIKGQSILTLNMKKLM